MQAIKSTIAFGEIKAPQQRARSDLQHIFRQTLCESTKSLSVNNLQAVHHVDITDYSLGAVASGLQKVVAQVSKAISITRECS